MSIGQRLDERDREWNEILLGAVGRGGKREGAGRKPSPDPLVGKRVTLRQDQWEYLRSLNPDNASDALRHIIDQYRHDNLPY